MRLCLRNDGVFLNGLGPIAARRRVMLAVLLAAPSNAAIASLPTYMVNFYTAPANLALLKGLLEYHVTPSVVNVADVVPDQKIPTVQGSNLFVEYIQGVSLILFSVTSVRADVFVCPHSVALTISACSASGLLALARAQSRS
jgi:hypothetical protein